MSDLLKLSRPAMLALAESLEAGSLAAGFSAASLRNHVPTPLVTAIQQALGGLADADMSPSHMAMLLRLLAAERAASEAMADRVELVWSGMKVVSGGSRDTAVVVQELFKAARRAVLIASFSVDAGHNAKVLFGALATRMDAEPDLEVRLFLNVKRRHKDTTTPNATLLHLFAERFRGKVWPGSRLPEVFYDPRALSLDTTKRACLHAKCIVIDGDRALVTSANFSEAAHARNIEAGVQIADAAIAKALKRQFDTLVEQGMLLRLPGLHGEGQVCSFIN